MTNGEIALKMWRFGWSIMPLQPNGKLPTLPAWKRLQAARAIESDIRSWWGLLPRANIGVITGRISNLVVVDCDSAAAIGIYQRAVGLHNTFAVQTARGCHFYYQHPPGLRVGNRAGLIEGVDIRGEGGYVVGAGSTHPSGAVYVVCQRYPVAQCPPRLIDLLFPPTPPPPQPSLIPLPPAGMTTRERGERWAIKALRDECGDVQRSPTGLRNSNLNRSAYKLGQLVGAGYLKEMDVIDALNSAGVLAGLSARETASTVRSGLSAGIRSPRYLSKAS